MHFDFSSNKRSRRFINYQRYTTNTPRHSSVAASIATDPSNPLAFQGKFVGNVNANKAVYGATSSLSGDTAPFSWTFTADAPVIDEYHSDGRTGGCGNTQLGLHGPDSVTSATAIATITNDYTGFDTTQSQYFSSEQLSLKRTSIDFCNASFLSHSKASTTCD
jgi:hypothetical protein